MDQINYTKNREVKNTKKNSGQKKQSSKYNFVYQNQIGKGLLDVNVLTYNISWEAMKGINTPGVFGEKCLVENDNICLNNVISTILSFDNLMGFDFIALQEASRWNKIYEEIKKKRPYIAETHHGLSQEKQVILYDSRKYEKQQGVYLIRSYLADEGRPFTIAFYRRKFGGKGVCIINMHPGHHKDFEQFGNHMYQTLMGQKTSALYSTGSNNRIKFPASEEENLDILSKLYDNDIIMMGDMNMNLKPNSDYKLFPNILKNKMLYGGNGLPTCCDSTLQSNVKLAYDQILSSSNNIQYLVPKTIMASDHLPLIAQINFEKCENLILE